MITDSTKYLKVKILTFHFHKHYFQLSKPLHVLRLLKYIMEDSFCEILKAVAPDVFVARRTLFFLPHDINFFASPTLVLTKIPARRAVICTIRLKQREKGLCSSWKY
jgi:hypothetical protein